MAVVLIEGVPVSNGKEYVPVLEYPCLPSDAWITVMVHLGPVDRLCLANTCKIMRPLVETEERHQLDRYCQSIDKARVRLLDEHAQTTDGRRLADIAALVGQLDQMVPCQDRYLFYQCHVPLGGLYRVLGCLRGTWMGSFMQHCTVSWINYFNMLDLSFRGVEPHIGLRPLFEGRRQSAPDLIEVLKALHGRGFVKATDLLSLLPFNRPAILDAFREDHVIAGNQRTCIDVCISSKADKSLQWLIGKGYVGRADWSTRDGLAAIKSSDEVAEIVLGKPMGCMPVSAAIQSILHMFGHVMTEPWRDTIERIKRYVGHGTVDAILTARRIDMQGGDERVQQDVMAAHRDVIVDREDPAFRHFPYNVLDEVPAAREHFLAGPPPLVDGPRHGLDLQPLADAIMAQANRPPHMYIGAPGFMDLPPGAVPPGYRWVDEAPPLDPPAPRWNPVLHEEHMQLPNPRFVHGDEAVVAPLARRDAEGMQARYDEYMAAFRAMGGDNPAYPQFALDPPAEAIAHPDMGHQEFRAMLGRAHEHLPLGRALQAAQPGQAFDMEVRRPPPNELDQLRRLMAQPPPVFNARAPGGGQWVDPVAVQQHPQMFARPADDGWDAAIAVGAPGGDIEDQAFAMQLQVPRVVLVPRQEQAGPRELEEDQVARFRERNAGIPVHAPLLRDGDIQGEVHIRVIEPPLPTGRQWLERLMPLLDEAVPDDEGPPPLIDPHS